MTRLPLARPFLGELTGLRFLAAFWVLGYHALPREGASQLWRGFWGAGHTGVTLFFVLSGFVLVYTYGPVDDAPIDVRSFLGARVARLFPVYLAALVIALPEFVRATMPAGSDPGLSTSAVAQVAVATPLMLQAWLPRIGCAWNCPGWSLSAEAFFYLLFPPIAGLLVARRSRTVLAFAVAAWVVGLACAMVRATPDSGGMLSALLHSSSTPLFRLPEFLVGMAAGRWYLDRRIRGVALQPGRGLVVVVLASAGIVAVAANSVPEPVDPLLGIWLLPLFAALILGLGERGNRGVLARPAAMFLGEVSYAVYLVHGPIHVYVLGTARRLWPGSLEQHPWPVFLAYVGTVLVTAVLLYHYLERPARLALRHRLARRPVLA